MAISLEQARGEMSWCVGQGNPRAEDSDLLRWADVITAHLTQPAQAETKGDERCHFVCICPDCVSQPAQAVDVGAIKAVIRELRTWPADATPYTYRTTCAEAVAKLTAALPTSPTPDKDQR